jgi:hypothetical protein
MADDESTNENLVKNRILVDNRTFHFGNSSRQDQAYRQMNNGPTDQEKTMCSISPGTHVGNNKFPESDDGVTLSLIGSICIEAKRKRSQKNPGPSAAPENFTDNSNVTRRWFTGRSLLNVQSYVVENE